MSTTEMAGTFRQAAEVVRDGGLAQGIYEDDGAHCAIGALMTAKSAEVRDVATMEPEISHLVDLIGGFDDFDMQDPLPPIRGFHTVTSWNDAYDRTADEVATLLEQASEKLEADL